MIYTGKSKKNVYGLHAEGFRSRGQSIRLFKAQFVDM